MKKKWIEFSSSRIKALQGSYPFLNKKFKDFQGHTSHFQGFHSVQKKSIHQCISSYVFPQHDQFYPEGLSVFAPFPLDRIKLALKFKDFPPPTVIFKDFQGLEFLFKIQRLSKCMQTLHISPRG